MMRVVMKPMNTKLDVVYTYVESCKKATGSKRLPETAEVAKLFNDKMGVSQTYVCIAKTQDAQEKIRNPRSCRFQKTFLVVSEEQDIGGKKEIRAEVTDSRKKQTLEIKDGKTLYHDKAP